MIEIDFKKTLYGAKGKFILDISLKLPTYEFISFFGKSGAGKTTILKILSGLIKPDSGRICVNDRLFFDSSKNFSLPIQKRSIGFVFQDYALFPHLNVYKNITFAQKSNKSRLDEVIALMELDKLLSKKTQELSGGQAQRVAIARALVSESEILLLDEPLSALDLSMRVKIADELKKLSSHFKLSSFLVSHDLGEVFRLSDKIVCIEEGKVSKIGTPDEIFLNSQYSGKISINGEILKIIPGKISYIIDVLIQNNITKVFIDKNEALGLKVGDKILLLSKAFSPIVVKI